jgi:SNF2 family DNA or RNA helicase
MSLINALTISSVKFWVLLIDFDFLLFDEAHRLRNSNTQLYKGVQQLVTSAKSVVMLTATPIMISEENLFNLLHLLDPLAYDNKLTFKNQINVNKPLISALSKLNNNRPFKQISEELKSEVIELTYAIGEEGEAHFSTMTVDEAFKGVELYERVIKDLELLEDSPENRVHIQFNLTNMSELNSIFSRTRKREVTTDLDQARREPHVVPVRLHDDERHHFDDILERYFQENSFLDPYGNQRLPQGKVLGYVQKKRRLASSVYGYLSDDDQLARGFDEMIKVIDSRQQNLAEQVCSALSYRLDNLSENEIKELDKDILHGIIEVLKDYMLII